MCDESPLYDEIPDYRYRLIDYVGDGFLIGAVSGSVFYFIKGILNSPNGRRLASGASAVRINAPRMGGRAAAYLALFCNFESAVYLARRREDHWNSIAAAAASSGVFSMRLGPLAAARSSLFGASLFVGLAGIYWGAELWQSSLRSCRESPLWTAHGVPEVEKGQTIVGDQILLYGREV